MTSDHTSPKIKHLSWGKLEVEGTDITYKDAKLWPGGSREWNWNETGTHHTPGIQIDDVKELLNNGAKTIILSRGINRRLKTQDKTLEWLSEHGIDTKVLQTEEAVKTYNQLANENKPVGALIHSTC